MSEREEYIRKTEAKLREWNAEIEKYEAKAKALQADVHAEYDRHIQELKKRRDETQAKLEELRLASDSAWQDVKKGLDNAWSALGDAFSSAANKFK